MEKIHYALLCNNLYPPPEAGQSSKVESSSPRPPSAVVEPHEEPSRTSTPLHPTLPGDHLKPHDTISPDSVDADNAETPVEAPRDTPKVGALGLGEGLINS